MEIMSQFSHQNIVKLVEKTEKVDRNYYIMDYYPGTLNTPHFNLYYSNDYN